MRKQEIIYKIRTATKKEADVCIYLSKTSWPDWWFENGKLGRRHVMDCVKEKRCLVAAVGRDIVAFIIWGNLWNKVHLQDIFVKEEYRRAGIAKSLIEKMIKRAKENGYKEVVSDCDVSNKTSISLHLKNGFKKCGYIKNNWGNENSYVFSRKI